MDFIPSKLAQKVSFIDTFSAAVTASPTTYGLNSTHATTLAALVTTMNTAFNASNTPATRTSVTIAATKVAVDNAVANVRTLAKIAQAYPTLSDANRETLGLTVPSDNNTPVPAPSSRPLIRLTENASNQHTIFLRDEATPESQAKPDGATAAEIWVKIGGDAPASVDDCDYEGDATRNPFTISYEGSTTGQPAYIIARWKTRTGLVGPESSPLLTTIAA